MAHLCHTPPPVVDQLTVGDFLGLVDFCEAWIAARKKQAEEVER